MRFFLVCQSVISLRERERERERERLIALLLVLLLCLDVPLSRGVTLWLVCVHDSAILSQVQSCLYVSCGQIFCNSVNMRCLFKGKS